MKDIFIQRLKFIYVVVFFLALAVGGKLFLVQIVQRGEYREEARSQYITPVSDIFNRGSVYFERKDGTLFNAATVKTGYVVAVNPSRIEHASSTYRALKAFIPDLDREVFFTKIKERRDPYEEVAHQISEETAEGIRKQNITGVSVHRERWRFYPHGSLAAHVVGFSGYRDESYGGRYGVERYYDDTLKREDKNLYVNFFAEVFANLERSLSASTAREGDLVLTIEPEVQRFSEDMLDELYALWDAKGAGVIVMDPRDGAVVALAARPSFDPNRFAEEDEYRVFSNPLVESVFEMGSIIKPLTMAVGLDSGALKEEDMYYDRGFAEVGGVRIENFDGEGRGQVPMQEILSQSLNTGAVYVMREAGKETLKKYFLSFGLGEETGIDLPNEAPGLLKNLNSPREVEYATASFGQGIAMTPVATLRALGALANKGVLVTPHVGKRIEYRAMPAKKISYGGEESVVRAETAETITRMLVKVVDEALLGGSVALPRHSIAAKTGTAQIARSDKAGYYDDRSLHTFFGYFPAYDPKFIVFLYLEEPKGVRYASKTLTGPFMDITKFLIHYYEISPDR